MNNLLDLLNDNIIDKSKLVEQRHEYLGLDATQAAFLAKIFINNEDSYERVSIRKLSELMNVDIETAQSIIEPLITNGLLGFVNEEGKSYFDFEKLIKKLLSSYMAPTESDLKEHKVKWIGKKLDFLLSDNNIIELRKIVDTTDWNIILKVMEKMSEQKDHTFPLLVSFIQSAVNNNEQKKEQIKSVMDVNWLE